MTAADGVLAVWKPAGMTSQDVVARVRRLLKTRRIGHTGTLDPQVTGVLPLCVGSATRLVEYLQDLPKEYVGTVQFGLATDTEDLTGNVVERAANIALAPDQIQSAMQAFIGEIHQVPPMYSAVKIGGKRLYELAREGQTVERQARPVTIYAWDVLQMDLDQELPRVKFRVRCSKGTYIRTLCVDLGRNLGVPAAMADLVRTASGNLREAQCHTLEAIAAAAENGQAGRLMLPADQAVAHFPVCRLEASLVRGAMNGRSIAVSQASAAAWQDGTLIRVYGVAADQGRAEPLFIGLFRFARHAGLLKPVKILAGTS